MTCLGEESASTVMGTSRLITKKVALMLAMASAFTILVGSGSVSHISMLTMHLETELLSTNQMELILV